jgi:hypothetical protein
VLRSRDRQFVRSQRGNARSARPLRGISPRWSRIRGAIDESGADLRILPEAQYRPHFDAYYRNFFATINTAALGGARRLIGFANAPTDAYSNFACPAFCAPANDVTRRRIYVNRDAGVTIGTLYHEFLHYLQHPRFYPEFYALGGRSPNVLEGVTEYLTRAVKPAVRLDREQGRKYQAWLDELMHALGLDPDDALDDQLAQLAFRGDYGRLRELTSSRRASNRERSRRTIARTGRTGRELGRDRRRPLTSPLALGSPPWR